MIANPKSPRDPFRLSLDDVPAAEGSPPTIGNPNPKSNPKANPKSPRDPFRSTTLLLQKARRRQSEILILNLTLKLTLNPLETPFARRHYRSGRLAAGNQKP
eukprot:213816-Prorocentrum_minimum.AAC.3